MLFCDLVGFTSRSERLDIEDVRGSSAPTTPACDQIEAQPEAAFARLQAAKQLVGAGVGSRRTNNLAALAFHRQVGATAYLGQADALTAASAQCWSVRVGMI